MNISEIEKYLNGCKITGYAELSKLCTFRTGGKADILCEPESVDALIKAVSFCRENGIKYCVLGRGSNVLFCDCGYDGMIISTLGLSKVSVNGNEITAECGAPLHTVCKTAEDASLCGIEFAYGIPGTVGGAVLMNAGAYGGEVSNVLKEISWYDAETNEIGTTPACDCDFAYRHSVFSDNKRLILSAVFTLEKGVKEEISFKMSDYMSRRREKQPLEYPSAGSTFKRPPNNFASKLIDECGLKGYTVGGAQISEKHAGFIINKSHATSDDILKLIEYTKKTVFEKTGVNLECEIILVK